MRRRPLEVEYLYIDLDVCERCQGTDRVLEEAVEQARAILGPTGVDLTLKKTHVRTPQQARRLGLLTSPTIRIMGRDAALDVKEDACIGCSALAGSEISCRLWTWMGKQHSVPPREMLLDAILRDAYLHPGGERTPPHPVAQLPENLGRFFQGEARRRPGMDDRGKQ